MSNLQKRRELFQKIELLASVGASHPTKAGQQVHGIIMALSELSNERMTMAKRTMLRDIFEKARYNGDAPGTVEFIKDAGGNERLYVNDEFNLDELAQHLMW